MFRRKIKKFLSLDYVLWYKIIKKLIDIKIFYTFSIKISFFYLFFLIWYNTNIGKSYLIGGEENDYKAKRKITSDTAGRNC